MTDLHARHQLREAVALALKAAGIVAADSVLPHRRRPTTRAQLPALMIYTEDETSGRLTADSLERRSDLVIRIRAEKESEDTPQDRLDALALQVERAIAAAGSLGGILQDMVLVRTSSGTSAVSDRQLGDMDLVWRAEIHTAENDPATIL